MIHIKTTFLSFILCLSAGYTFAQPKVIVHHEFRHTEKSAQNLLAALTKADYTKCHGSEFDVWLSSDGPLIVHHNTVHSGFTS